MRKYIFLLIVVFFFYSCNKEAAEYRQAMREAVKAEHGRDLSDLESAARIYKTIINAKVNAASRFVEVNQLLAERSINASQYPRALVYISNALEVEPSNAGLHYYAGISYGHWAEAQMDEQRKQEFLDLGIRHIRYAAEKLPKMSKYHASLAVMLTDKKQYSDGLVAIRKAINLVPDSTDYLFIRARIEYLAGNIQDAIRTYRQIESIALLDADKEAAKQNASDILREGN